MNCKEIEKYLPLYPEDVEPGIKEEIELHLSKCSSCSALYESLGLYRSYVLSVGEVDAPEDFETNVIRKLEPGNKTARIRELYKKTAIVISSAAAVLILALLLWPESEPWKNAIEASFVLQTEKKGKGPAELINIEKVDESILRILQETGAAIEMKEENPVTGYYDFIIAGVPSENLDLFINKFNQASSTQIKLQGNESVKKAMSYLKIYFDVINFTVGNFDGDGHADLVIQFLSGRNKGKWIMYRNNDSTHFTEYQYPDMGKDETKYLGDYWMIPGDFNGDGLDDICLYAYSRQKGLSKQILLNHPDFKFKEADDDFMATEIPSAENGKFFSLIAGESDGDGKDDLIMVSAFGEDTYKLSTPGNIQAPITISIPDVYTCSGVVLGGDLNGDHYVDIWVKYLRGERTGQTWFYLNNKQGFFSDPKDGNLSFAGDYIFLTGDYDGDGLDDLFVKSGGPFFSGDWEVMRNDGSGKLIFEKVFKLEFPGE